MHILVTGGTGLIGSHTVDQLLQLYPQDPLYCLTRNPLQTARWGQRVKLLEGNVCDPPSLERATRGMEVVIHAVQFPNHPVENPRKGWTYLEVDGKGTVATVNACKANGVRRFVYLSGAGVEPGRQEPWFRAKAVAEQAVVASGMEYVIFRPSWVYGPGDRSLNKFVAFTRYLPVVPVIGDGKGTVQPVCVFDLAHLVAQAVTKREATNKIFPIGGPETLSLNAILYTIQRVLGKKRFLIHHPVGLMKFLARLMVVLPNSPLSPEAIDFILMNEQIDSRETLQVFGARLRPLEEGLRSYLR